MINKPVTRRRAFSIFAGTAAAAISLPAFASEKTVEWNGMALGAEAKIVLYSENKEHAEAAIQATVNEISRLENIFSLFLGSSELVRLNQSKYSESPSHDMRQLMTLSQNIHKMTEGLFNPAIQKLWRFYADWFSDNKHEMPQFGIISKLREQSDFSKATVNEFGIHLEDGMELSFNGIAQGYITDRIADLLRARGWSNVLLDIGEVRGLDGKPDGKAWKVAIRDSGHHIPVKNNALATSSGRTLSLSAENDLKHILNPHTGLSEKHWKSITVSHNSAAVADALSTSLYSASTEQLERIKRKFKDLHVWAVPENT